MRTLYRLGWIAFLCAPLAQAHPNLRNTMWVQFEPEQIRIAVEVSVKELSVVAGFVWDENGSADSQILHEAARSHPKYLVRHLKLSAGETILAGQVVKLTPPPQLAGAEETFFQYDLLYPLIGPLPPEITFQHNMLKEWAYSPGVPWQISYVLRAKTWDSDQFTSWLLASEASLKVPTDRGIPNEPPRSQSQNSKTQPPLAANSWWDGLRAVFLKFWSN